MSQMTLRQRLVRGAQAQVASHLVRLVVQVGGVSVLAGVWGVHLYGEWLILFAVPSYLAFSDVGLFAAGGNEMIMQVARGEREGAAETFRAVSVAVTVLLSCVALLLLAVVSLAPIRTWLHLHLISQFEAGGTLLALGLDTFLIAYAGILYGGFACEGRYGEGGYAIAGILLVEFLAMATAVLLGGTPLTAAVAMLAARLVGTAGMYAWMRRRVPWLRLGRPERVWAVVRPLVSPAAASGAMTASLAINVQGLVILLGAVSGPAAVAVFSTLRTMTRVVIQLLTSIFNVLTPEFSKAFAERNLTRLRMLHRAGCQVAIWVAGPILVVLAVAGTWIVHVWTGGTISPPRSLLYLFLLVAGLESLWTTSFGVSYAANRHQGLALRYLIASAAVIPVAWALYGAWGLDGPAAALLLLEVAMLGFALRPALVLSGDDFRGWLRSLVRPELVGLLRIRAASELAPPVNADAEAFVGPST